MCLQCEGSIKVDVSEASPRIGREANPIVHAVSTRSVDLKGAVLCLHHKEILLCLQRMNALVSWNTCPDKIQLDNLSCPFHVPPD